MAVGVTCLNVSLTNRCPLQCEHCGPESGPSQSGHVDGERVIAALGDAKRAGCVVINLTGGEPFVEAALMKAVITAARDQGLHVRATTSGYWATSSTRALDTLAPFVREGLDQLCLSRTLEHAAFVPVQRVVWAVAAARNHGLVVSLVFGQRVGSELEMERLEAAFREMDVPKPPVFTSRIIPVGRAAQTRPLEDHLLQPMAALVMGCPSVARNPHIYPDGTVVACGVVFGRQCEALHVGSLRDEALETILDRMEDNPLLALIATEGPAGVKAIVERNSSERFADRYAGICHLCHDVLANPRAKQVLTKVLAVRRCR